MRIDATDPHRLLPVDRCTTVGGWCQGRWLEPGAVCVRRFKCVERDVPCPDVTEEIVTVFALVQHCARHDGADTVHCAVVNGTVWTARGLAEQWRRPQPRTPTDVLDDAGRTGRCAACAYVCDVCRGQPTGACRFHDRCCLAEEHVVRCSATRVRWLTLSPTVRATLRDKPALAPTAPQTVHDATLRKHRRKIVRTWAKKTTKVQRAASD